jgi:hypothetical protein
VPCQGAYTSQLELMAISTSAKLICETQSLRTPYLVLSHCQGSLFLWPYPPAMLILALPQVGLTLKKSTAVAISRGSDSTVWIGSGSFETQNYDSGNACWLDSRLLALSVLIGTELEACKIPVRSGVSADGRLIRLNARANVCAITPNYLGCHRCHR